MYSAFINYLNSNKPNRISYFDVESEDDYYHQDHDITVTIQYSYNSTYDDWSDYSYAISKARELVYKAWRETCGRYPDSYHLVAVKEENVYNDWDWFGK